MSTGSPPEETWAEEDTAAEVTEAVAAAPVAPEATHRAEQST